MKNIAIIIANSEYTNVSPLPGCVSDGDAMKGLIDATGTYSDVLYLKNTKNAELAKEEIISFIDKNKQETIGTLVFYYTGHGEFVANEFYYPMLNYDRAKRRVTSLENGEIDSVIKACNPEIFVKIIDACQSGVSYIKDAESIKGVFSSAKAGFNKIYFMFSSQYDQNSYQSSVLSDFTGSFLAAIASNNREVVRYKYIMDYISDDFDKKGNQTPYFVVQADLVESFCRATPEIIASISKFIKPHEFNQGEGEKKSSFLDRIRADACNFCSKEEAEDISRRMLEVFSVIDLDTELSELYEIKVSCSDSLPNIDMSDIGKWISSNKKGERLYFAEAVTRRVPVEKRVPKNALANMVSLINGIQEDQKVITVEEPRITGFNQTEIFSYAHINIFAKARFPNINTAEWFVVPIFSRTHVRLFWRGCRHESIGWDNYRRTSLTPWNTEEAMMKSIEEIDSIISQIQRELIEYIRIPLIQRWGGEGEGSGGEGGGEA